MELRLPPGGLWLQRLLPGSSSVPSRKSGGGWHPLSGRRLIQTRRGAAACRESGGGGQGALRKPAGLEQQSLVGIVVYGPGGGSPQRVSDLRGCRAQAPSRHGGGVVQ